MTLQPNAYALLDPDDSLLVAIDVQDGFLDKLLRQQHTRLLNNICWVIALAQWRQIPLIVTAEELPHQPLASKLVDALPPNTPIFDKVTFGLAHQPDILAAVVQTGRKTAVLIGLETDVCVMHSAIGLLELGYRVAVVTDAVGTPAPGQEIGLNRMQRAGAIMVNKKGLFYEWLRTIDAVKRFHRECPDMRDLAGDVL